MKKSRPPGPAKTKPQAKSLSRGPADPEVPAPEKPEIVKEEHPLVPRLRAAIGCPVDWAEHAPQFPYLWKDLRIIWAQTAEQFETCGEMRFYERLDIDTALDEAELRRIEINARIWRPRAVDAYMQRVGFLTKLKFATSSEQSKHYPNPAWSAAKIVTTTAKGNALFYHDTTIFYLRALLWTAISQRLLDVLENHPQHLYVLAKSDVGASKGLSTRLLRIDIDYSKPLAHGHPILPSELPAATEPAAEVEGVAETFSQDIYTQFNNDIDESRNPGYCEHQNALKKGVTFIPHKD